MGLNNYPYTNFHEMNLDWILEQFQKEISRLEELEAFKIQAGQDISELQRQTSLLNTAIATLRNAQASLEARQDAVELLVSGYNQRITTNTNNIAGLAEWQTEANSTLADHEDRIDELEDSLSELVTEGLPQQVIDDLMDYVRDNLPELLGPLEDDIDALETAMTAAEDAITALTSGKLNAGKGVTMQADLNSLTTAGIYYCLPVYTTVNVPDNAYGLMLVQVLRDNGNELGDVIQTAYVYRSSGQDNYMDVYYRHATYLTVPDVSYEWLPWRKILTDNDLDSVESSISSMEPVVEQLVKQVSDHNITNLSDFKDAVIDAGSGKVITTGISAAGNVEITGINASAVAIAKYVSSSNRIDFIVFSGTNSHITSGYIDTSTDTVTLSDVPFAANTLSYKSGISSSADLDDYKDVSGTYLMSSIATHAPDNAKAYSILMVIKSPTSLDTTQLLIHGTSGAIWTRRYHGSPAVWDNWSEITRANVVKVDYTGDISSMSNWGSMARTDGSVITGTNFGTFTTDGIRLNPGVYKVTAIALYPAKASGWYGVALSGGDSNLPYYLSGAVQTQAGFSGTINRLSCAGVFKVSSVAEYKLLFGSNQTSMSDISGTLILERLA